MAAKATTARYARADRLDQSGEIEDGPRFADEVLVRPIRDA
jgi:hypothetical protein